MKKFPSGLIFSALLLAVLSCVNTAQSEEDNSHNRGSEIPDWYLNPPVSGIRLYGLAAVRSDDLAWTKEAAVERARKDIAEQLSRSLSAMLASYLRETGQRGNKPLADWAVQAAEETAQLDLREAVHRKTYPLLERNGDFTVYVLVEYERNRALNGDIAGILRKDEEERPENFSTAALLEKLKTEMEKNPPRPDGAGN